MIVLKIRFEGTTFVANVNGNNITITNEIILPVNAQMFSHIKETLVREIGEGVYNMEIANAIKQKWEMLVL